MPCFALCDPGDTMMEWWHVLCGIIRVFFDLLLQKFRCRHLPTRLPLPPSSHMTVIVTGATSGIGVEIARELAKAGAHIVLAVRNPANGEKLVRQWEGDQKAKDGLSISAEVMALDLLSLSSVRKFAKQWESRRLPLTALINNAGIFAMGVKQKFSEDGFEHHMQVNHLGNALLSILLLPSLLRGGPSRVINVNSEMHFLGIVDPEDFNLTKRKYSSMAAYSNSKLAQILFSHVLYTKIPKDADVDIINVHPGEVMTAMTRDLPVVVQKAEIISTVLRFSPIEGARSVLFCATDQQVYRYARAQRNVSCPLAPYYSPSCKPAQMASLAGDLRSAEKVWAKSLELLGIREDQVDQAGITKSAIEDLHSE